MLKDFQNLDWEKILQTLKPYFKLKSFTFVFLITSALLLLMTILSLSIILNNMYTMIFYVWILSIIGLAYKGYSWLWDKAQSKIETSRAEHLAVIEASRQRQELLSKINALSEGEKNILQIVSNGNNCGVWVAEKDENVLTLLYKGIIEKISDKGTYADWKDGLNGREYCILVVISKPFHEILNNV